MILAHPTATTEKDAADVRAILDALVAAYRARDAEAIGRHYVPGARIADLAPPLLRRGFHPEGVQTWLDGGDGPVEIATRDVVAEVDGDLAVAHGVQHVRARTRGGEDAAWWSRITHTFARRQAGGSPTSTSRCRSTWTAASGRPWTSNPEPGDSDARRRRERDPPRRRSRAGPTASTDEAGRLKMSASTRPTIPAFERSPDGGRGLARDMRVRWALEEVGRHYDVRPVSFAAMKEAAHRTLNPFGQIPTYEGGEVPLFESGAIVLHIATCHAGLLPADATGRARALSWMFAAVGTLEPAIVDREVATYLEREEAWFERRLRAAEDRIRGRLNDLSPRLGDADWLDDDFSASDLMMVDVLRRLGGSVLLGAYPSLLAYVGRAAERPAFRRAFDAQRAFFEAGIAASKPAAAEERPG